MADHKDTADSLQEVPSNDAIESSEDNISTWQCLKENPKIILWTLYANTGALMIGYDNLTLSVCLAMPSFQMMFGEPFHDAFIIPAHWQSLWNALFNVTTMIGSFGAGYIQDRLGRRSVFLLTIIIATAGIAINFTAATKGVFLAGKMVTGLAIGLVLSGAQTYISEITPLPIRGIGLSVYAIFMNLGMLIGISSTFHRIAIMDPIAYRLLFAIAWIFPGLLAVGLLFMPESPYWLVMKGDTEKAERMLRRLRNTRANTSAQLAQMVATAEAERRARAESKEASFVDCFRGTNWRRTRAMLIMNYIPQVIGANLSANAPYFLSQTGMAGDKVVTLVQVGISFGVASAILNVLLMTKFFYRHLIISGVGLCAVLFLIMGIAGCFPRNIEALWAVGMSLQITPWSYGPSIGASLALAGEISAVRLRAKSLGVATAFAYLCSTIWFIVLPYLFNADQANLGGKIGFIFFGQALLMLAVLYFDVPETKGFTFEQLDELFENKVATRKFQTYFQERRQGAAEKVA